ncbi:PREDICTED: methionine adenosyltransferase 2 subunit beta-like [Branchiostoma belcheri]|uniref:Methionine adenosyltransferase 2 subunit beta n=1 Tax=Branchiostoma belcheri TaxID=7741 RepID=A0A6P5ADS5_BRABE|nr:PREDICTED: methionine adenosyltransferase 2 subunit beta-like [Branchiostoma belcheri]
MPIWHKSQLTKVALNQNTTSKMGRVLITGASGLLGRALIQEFQGTTGWEVLGLAFSRSGGKLKKVDLRDQETVKKTVQEFKPDVVIHSAVKKSEAACVLNVELAITVAQAAADVGAFLVYVSTDYVFDGRSPPYKVTDRPNPLNKYGISKLAGEMMALEIAKDGAVLRVPMLYGPVETVDESAVTVLFRAVQNSEKTANLSDYERRYPTHVGDIAAVCRQLSEKRLLDSSLHGVFHWSADEEMTKYMMAVTMAEVLKLPSAHLVADKEPFGATQRPYDAHLDTN